MIPRYSRPEMVVLWEDQNRLEIFLKIEIYAAEALAKYNFIPAHVAEIVKKFAAFDVDIVAQIEKDVRHDVIAFLTNVQDNIVKNAIIDGYKIFSQKQVQDAIRYLHYGMTSSDVLDTAFSYQLAQSSDLILAGLEKVCDKLKEMAIIYKHQICIGRSHGVHAEPISFGQKLLLFYAEFKRCVTRMKTAKEEIARCMISGPVGNFSASSPQIEEFVAEKLGLKPEIISSQIISRDRYASFFTTLAVIASSIEHLAVEIRHLQRTEVLEAEEGFGNKQKGSSAMPHKKNPVLSENLTGLARMIRSYALPALENVALWHERDISHSSVERIIGPDACILMDFALVRLYELLNNLVIHSHHMERNIEILGDMHYSHIVLLALTRLGLSRDEAYKIVQSNAMKAWKERNGKFLETLKEDETLLGFLNKYHHDKKDFFKGIEDHNYLKFVDEVFAKILAQEEQV